MDLEQCGTCDFWERGYCYRRDWEITKDGHCREWEPKGDKRVKTRLKYKKGKK